MQPTSTEGKADMIAAWLLRNTIIYRKDQCDAYNETMLELRSSFVTSTESNAL